MDYQKRGKAELSIVFQLFPRALDALARTSNHGQEKHCKEKGLAPDSYASRENAEQLLTDAMLRHIVKALNYDDIKHDAAVAWNAMARLEVKMRERENAPQERN